MARLDGLQIANLAKQAGFNGAGLVKAVAISKRESGWDPEAWNGDTSTGDQSVGLMQINMMGQLGEERMRMLQALGYKVNSVEEAIQLLKDPTVNLRFAYNMSSGGTDFYHWGPYKGVDALYNTDPEEAAQLASQATGEPIQWSGGGGRSMNDPEYAKVVGDVQSAYEAWRTAAQGMDPDAGYELPEYEQYLTAVQIKQDYEAAFNIDTSSSAVDPAQQAFENQITLGDYRLGEGKMAYDRWADKYNRAQAAANEQISNAVGTNEANEKMRAARLESKAPTLMPRASSITLRPPTYDAAFARWKKEMGVGEEPALYGTGGHLPAPGAPSTGSGFAETEIPSESGPSPSANHPFKAENLVPQPSPSANNPFKASNIDQSRSLLQTGQGDTNILDRYEGSNVWDVAGGSRNSKGQETLFGVPFKSGWKAAWEGALFGDPKYGNKERLADRVDKVRRFARKVDPRKVDWFAEGVQNYEGGMAVVGEEGEEVVELPGVGRVKASGPTLMNLPKGANVIPRDQVMAQQRIGELAKGGNDLGQKARNAQLRRDDPELQAKVLASLQRAMAAQVGMKPGPTPTLEPGTKDYWAWKRPLTGTPVVLPMEVQ